jgi:hypothetical protein
METNDFIRLSTAIKDSKAYKDTTLRKCLTSLLSEANVSGKVVTTFPQLSRRWNRDNAYRIVYKLERLGEIKAEPAVTVGANGRLQKRLLITIVHYKMYVQ